MLNLIYNLMTNLSFIIIFAVILLILYKYTKLFSPRDTTNDVETIIYFKFNNFVFDTDKEYLDEVEMCSICLDDLDKDIVILKCQHKFHSPCIKEWVLSDCKKNNTCPLCKKTIDIDIVEV